MKQQGDILRGFIKEMKAMAGEDYQVPVMNWLEFACDLCEDNPSGLGNELEGILRSLLFVKNNFGAEVLASSLKALMLSSEVIYGAMLLQGGRGIDTVLEDCSLKGAVITHSNFAGAKLLHTALTDARLQDCCIEGTVFERTDIEQADMQDCSNDEQDWSEASGPVLSM